ncbi:ATP-binding cassette domain-containing protein [bacterium]|nr:ATP-binding cassette domain-containing protein [bacterium]
MTKIGLSTQQEVVLTVDEVHTNFGETQVHRGISFAVQRGSIVSLIGGSGCGKSTLLREIIGLHKPTSGSIRLFDVDVYQASEDEVDALRRRFGVLFQHGALFSGLTVLQNVLVPFWEQFPLEQNIAEQIALLRLELAGLKASDGSKMPSELSGGMRKRAALARALALEPEFLFLDEPTSGLDPINARAFDKLIYTLSRSLGLTVMIVTHDLDSIISISDRVIVLDQGVVVADGSVSAVMQDRHPWIQEYFSSRQIEQHAKRIS